MFSRARPNDDAAQGGFTLVEMMFALGVLVFGMTSLIGVLSVGVTTRRTAEQRSRAALLVDQVVHRIEQEVLANVTPYSSEAELEELEIETLENELASDYPGMKYSVRFRLDEDYPELILATIGVAWLEQGETVAQKFHRILPRQIPFSQRVEALRRNP